MTPKPAPPAPVQGRAKVEQGVAELPAPLHPLWGVGWSGADRGQNPQGGAEVEQIMAIEDNQPVCENGGPGRRYQRLDPVLTHQAKGTREMAETTLPPNPSRRHALTVERLKELLDYDPLTGVFRWRHMRTGVPKPGMAAGSVDEGYRRISVDGIVHRAHRLAWLYMTGAWPAGEIDHENRVRDDNRFINLRDATHGQNRMNSRGHAVSGLKGATFHKKVKRWYAQAKWDGKHRHLGYFDTAEEAHDAYCRAAAEHNPEFWRGK